MEAAWPVAIFSSMASILSENKAILPAKLRRKTVYYCQKLSGEAKDRKSPDIEGTLLFIKLAIQSGRYRMNEFVFACESIEAIDIMLEDWKNHVKEKDATSGDSLDQNQAN